MDKADFGVFIGRFQPLHTGHEHVIAQALERVSHLIILVGSANVARNPRDPFTFEERKAMIGASFAYEIAQERLIIQPLNDHLYSDTAWITEVQRLVHAIVLDVGNGHGHQNSGTRDFTIALTGYGKDASSYYLNLFPQWGNIQIDSQYGTFSSSDIRARYFQRIPEVPTSILSAGVAAWLNTFKMTSTFAGLLAEAEYLADYPTKWGKGPFITADAVVVQSGHLLLVERGGLPGKGLLALPGGFVDAGERIRDAAIRELQEETQISDETGELNAKSLSALIEDRRSTVFDAPNRSLRGRVITHAFLFRLPDQRELYRVKGSDDAVHASWHKLGDLRAEMFFEDHWSIIEHMADL
jgi:bifunctional NMN adenylyltransferase/nudix hydrolase